MIHTKKLTLSILFIFIAVLSGLAQTEEDKSETLKVMSYNIWNGFEWGKDTERKAKCIEWIKSKKPDVVALQELCGYTEEMLKEDALKWGHEYVQLLKTEGYPTALTSNRPIKLKERKIDSFWHGVLHCETYGIDFYVVHLSPADAKFRLKEAKMIAQDIQESKSDNYIILGDFNASSPFDAYALEKNNSLHEKYRPKGDNKYSNLLNGNFDYSVIGQFLACPAVDLALNKVDLVNAGHTFPTPALTGKYNNTDKSIVANRVRIDYIFASPNLSNTCEKLEILNQKKTHELSDHYPLMAEFKL
ncbi:endonuclease/exonuclease/phosphatase family protein [Flagellimonas pacifica]|uniref:Metal-dependent hydrolase, endonuclease/exonuclease/phosphatase family n=1 Tax=Flagellimonas pacifica TaxID=1247520 RepID=A0A285MS39_9FLAO|nr:endonuclease/exonuclease/phosphatase family protein [Allomuricauda parva]SNZ00019.1 Metal-dependent hydrolase, endonuclease/exonuclease/phosphatase family [Allomuricauda parva]